MPCKYGNNDQNPKRIVMVRNLKINDRKKKPVLLTKRPSDKKKLKDVVKVIR